MTTGITKERLREVLDRTSRKTSKDLLSVLINECTELHPIPEYKKLPQTVCAQEGTVINISDGYGRGKWLSTKEGWIPYAEEKLKELRSEHRE